MQIIENHAGGISIIAFVFAVVVSMAYYQFVYLPEVNARPTVSEEVLNPSGVTNVNIVEGSALPSQTQNYEPKEVTANLGESNKVVWTNQDTTAHTVTTDTGYNDPINGEFDSMATIGLVLPQQTYEFTFTAAGEYPYHCEPHPWMTGKVTVERGRF
ncbi:MAG TPA: plastocyanin/azurin family copper-binding protein [Nitrososphaeraceae archaeon]|jgi:plastocyanin